MKKLLGILVLGLLLTFSSNGISGEMNVFKKKIKLPKDVAQGYKNAWKFCCNKKYEIVVTIKTIITQIERLTRSCFSLEFDCKKLGSTNINTPIK